MSSIWAFPAPAREGAHRCPAVWPGWALSTFGGWALDELDPKLLMRLAPQLAEQLAAIEPGPNRAPQAGAIYIVWEE
ncbi:MAG TPA: hypothetical protein PLJ35_01050 [Anaerolineae bacterium]|nr:hypothetical protein [Anaerolineae bacterium]HOQ97391.1 hypothetical protein [Anaerolineae bacterium]HPL29781.1 hypothetical protein [Anaerolineae bacterium]